jgi:hypothetical protein
MFYATTDNTVDETCIDKSADILAFASYAEAERYLKDGLSPEDFDLSEARVIAGRFPDCWQKWYGTKPDLSSEADLLCFAPFSADNLRVQEPGTHPGGNAWWITPIPNVLVLTGVKPRE